MLDEPEFRRWRDAALLALRSAAGQVGLGIFSWACFLAEQAAHGLLAVARRFATALPPELDVRAVVVFGSVARGDFNETSDVDVLVVADRVPDRFLERLDALGPRPPRVEPHVWTPAEWRHELERGNPIVTEARERGVWLTGSADELRR